MEAVKNEKAPVAENKMGVMPVNKLLVTMSLPMMISMLVQALYNIVDSVFVAQISENALTAVSLAFPIQSLVIAVSSGACVGVNAILSKSLGEKNEQKANEAAENGIFLAVISYIIFVLVGIFVTAPFYASQTKDTEIFGYGSTYLTIVCVCSLGCFVQMMSERILQSTGKTFYTMITQGTGAIINIILDPILIFGLFGLPRLEVAGAAIATVIGQIVAAIMAVAFNLKYNHEVHISFKGFRPNGKMIGKIISIGIPSTIMQAIGSVMVYGMNRILIGFSSTATAVFGVYFKLQSFAFMPVFGLNNGMVPIVAFNYGAAKRERMIKTIKLSIGYAMGIMIFCLIIMQVFPKQLLQIFSASEQMIAIGVPALRIISISYIFAGFCIIVGTVFQALGNGVYSLIVSVLRQLVVLLPAAYLFSRIGLEYVWCAFPLAEIMSVLVSAFFMWKINKDIISKIGK